MCSANVAAAPSRALSEILAQYTPLSLFTVTCGDEPGAAAPSTPAEHPWPTGMPRPNGKRASDGTDGPVTVVSVRATAPARDILNV
jgi:hypothetical protein